MDAKQCHANKITSTQHLKVFILFVSLLLKNKFFLFHGNYNLGCHGDDLRLAYIFFRIFYATATVMTTISTTIRHTMKCTKRTLRLKFLPTGHGSGM